ncbi:hypothetical protein PR048_002586 [Dryococelus australis]|uniref:Uncharacterized protein n=1 Tax=Dryococelus australis TaxID=614101 RepID=A0ABQ9IKM3_9NEOP|nr:hypothetical protein PR048_002586 [Dryococelus australis]
MRLIDVNMKQLWNEGVGVREIPENTRRPMASSGTIPTCESPVTWPGIEPENVQKQQLTLQHCTTRRCISEQQQVEVYSVASRTWGVGAPELFMIFHSGRPVAILSAMLDSIFNTWVALISRFPHQASCRHKPTLSFQRQGELETWAALINIKVLRADEGEAREREITEKSRRPTASSGTIPTFENPGAAPLEIEPGSPWLEASSLTTTTLRPLLRSEIFTHREGTFSVLAFCAVFTDEGGVWWFAKWHANVQKCESEKDNNATYINCAIVATYTKLINGVHGSRSVACNYGDLSGLNGYLESCCLQVVPQLLKGAWRRRQTANTTIEVVTQMFNWIEIGAVWGPEKNIDPSIVLFQSCANTSSRVARSMNVLEDPIIPGKGN